MDNTSSSLIKETSIIKELIEKVCTIEQLDYLLQLDKTPGLEAHALGKRAMLLNEELNRMREENRRIKNENLLMKQEVDIQVRIMESQRKEIDNYRQLINETDSKIELQQERKSDNYDGLIWIILGMLTLTTSILTPASMLHIPTTPSFQEKISSTPLMQKAAPVTIPEQEKGCMKTTLKTL
jgi:hypothetical protein